MSVEDILIRSSNIGTLMLAEKIGERDYKDFIKETNCMFNTYIFTLCNSRIPLIKINFYNKTTKEYMMDIITIILMTTQC